MLFCWYRLLLMLLMLPLMLMRMRVPAMDWHVLLQSVAWPLLAFSCS